MKVVIAIDSFKGSMSSYQAGCAVKNGIQRVYNDADITVCPIADGGEGTAYALISAYNGEKISVSVTGPVGRKVNASYGIIGNLAIMEMASCAGLTLIDKSERNPLYTTTYGVGEMILDALDRGCRDFIIGIGGSATNDGGVGMLQALGFDILDKDRKPVSYGAVGVRDIAFIGSDNADKRIKKSSFNIACDVDSTLCGETGASFVFARQKGASEEDIPLMDRWLYNYAKKCGGNMNARGAGAAGGMGFAFMTFLNARLLGGIGLVMEKTGLEDKIRDADIVITGEGCLDNQSEMGKAPVGVAKLAKKYNKPVIALAGSIKEYNPIFDACFPIVRGVTSLENAMTDAVSNITQTTEQIFRLIKVGKYYE